MAGPLPSSPYVSLVQEQRVDADVALLDASQAELDKLIYWLCVHCDHLYVMNGVRCFLSEKRSVEAEKKKDLFGSGSTAEQQPDL